MTELQETQKQLDEVLDRIPITGSFESARLAKQASKLADKIVELCADGNAPYNRELQLVAQK